MDMQRVIDVKKQRDMTLRETFNLCIHGVRHRLLRSMLTLSVVTLAVAFFMFLLSESMFMGEAGKGVSAEIEAGKFGAQTLTRILSRTSTPVLVQRLSKAHRAGDEAALREAAAVSGWDIDRVRAMAEDADGERTYSDWLANITPGKRITLIERREGRAAIEYIRDNFDRFRADIAQYVDISFPRKGGIQALEAYIARYSDYVPEMDEFLAAWNGRVDEANAALGAAMALAPGSYVSEVDWIERADIGAVRGLAQRVRDLGFDFSDEDLATTREQLAWASTRGKLWAKLNNPDFRTEWMRVFRETKRSTSEEKLLRLDDKRAIDLLQNDFGADVLTAAAPRSRRERYLAKLERALLSATGGEYSEKLSGRQVFLLCISFVVCMVGIANAMLMSITERFREIATMKCLGATDKYILSQFMMEAALQGVCGGVFGVIIGFVIAFIRNLVVLGPIIFQYWPHGGIAVCAVLSLVAGVVLAVLASIQPSWSASRMAPMEAMRVE